jgi:hypothetical protein
MAEGDYVEPPADPPLLATVVKYEIDLFNPPRLTAAQKAELKALRAKADSEIDYSDIPPLTMAGLSKKEKANG